MSLMAFNGPEIIRYNPSMPTKKTFLLHKIVQILCNKLVGLDKK